MDFCVCFSLTIICSEHLSTAFTMVDTSLGFLTAQCKLEVGEVFQLLGSCQKGCLSCSATDSHVALGNDYVRVVNDSYIDQLPHIGHAFMVANEQRANCVLSADGRTVTIINNEIHCGQFIKLFNPNQTNPNDRMVCKLLEKLAKWSIDVHSSIICKGGLDANEGVRVRG